MENRLPRHQRFFYDDRDEMRLDVFANNESEDAFETLFLTICGDPLPLKREDAMTLWFSDEEITSLQHFFTSLNTFSDKAKAFEEGEKVQIDIMYFVNEKDMEVPEEAMTTLSETLAGLMSVHYFAGMKEVARLNTYKIIVLDSDGVMIKIAICHRIHDEEGKPMTYDA